MMGFVDRLRSSAVPAQIVAWWSDIGTRWNPVGIIIGAWALLALPLIFFRGFNSDEGFAVTAARTALETGDWLTPHLFNIRFVERPMLHSWIIAAISVPFGSVGQFTARLPIVLFLLAGCLLIYALLRRIAASAAAALLGAALFLACPLVLRSYVMTTADMPLAVLLFLAFVLWWNGYSQGHIAVARWLAIGGVLALAGLMKGPQPIAYFALGVGVFVLATRSWRQFPGFILAGAVCVIPLIAWYWYVYVPGDEAQWAHFMRLSSSSGPLSGPFKALLELTTETLPAMLLAVVFLLSLLSEQVRAAIRVPLCFIPALACYAFVAALIILFWPGGSTARYFLPMLLPLCVFGGLGYDALAARRPQFVAPVLIITLGILVYGLVYSVVASPLLPHQFRSAQIDAKRITELVRASPATIYRTGAVGLNVFPLVPGPIIGTDMTTLETVAAPAWIAVDVDQAKVLIAKRPTMHEAIPFGSDNEWRLLKLDN